MFQACPNAMTVNEDGVHSCVQCNVLHHALFPAYATEIPENNISVISDKESAMSTMENSNGEADFLMLAPTEDDMNMEIAQSGNEKASGAVSTNVDKGPMSNTVPADNISLVKNPDKAIGTFKLWWKNCSKPTSTPCMSFPR